MQQKIYLGKIAELIATINGCSISVAESFVKALCALISEELQKGHSVKIKGLGTFSRSGNSIEPIALELDKEIINSINLPFAFFDSVELDEDLTEELFEQELEQLDANNSYILHEANREENDSKLDDVISEENQVNSTIEEEYGEDVNTANNQNLINDEANQQKPQSGMAIVNEGPDLNCNNKQETNQDDPKVNEEENIADDYYCNKENRNKPNISYIFTFVIALLIGLIIGFFGGIYTKSFIDNETLTKQINEQKIILDSLVSNKNASAQSYDTINRDTTLSNIRVDSINKHNDNLNIATKFQTDKVTSKRYLTTMSREYYGNFNFWVYIYEENKSKLGNPNAIRPGTIVVIPPASKYGIDANNPQSVEIAKQKAIEIYSKYTN